MPTAASAPVTHRPHIAPPSGHRPRARRAAR
jgi:hypothetical protein